MTFRLFSYGTLRRPEVQRAVFGRVLEGAPDVLPGFTVGVLRITDPSVVAVSGSAEHPVLERGGPKDRVEGVALTVTDEDLIKADAYESGGYRRALATLASGHEAFVYVRR